MVDILNNKLLSELVDLSLKPGIRFSNFMYYLRQAICLRPREELLLSAFMYTKYRSLVPGDFVEFGVFRGECLMHAYHILKFLESGESTFGLMRG